MTKRLFYTVCKWVGLFHLSRMITRRGLRILAYHGFSLRDEKYFQPQLFMDTDLFRQRMQFLVRKRYPVLPLSEATLRLPQDTLPPAATVITLDDGFFSIWSSAVPILRELNLPATVYVTTYYVTNPNPVFRLAIQYIFWKTKETQVDLTGLEAGRSGPVSIHDHSSRHAAAWQIINHAEVEMDEDQRVRLCQELGSRLRVNVADLRTHRLLSLMTPAEIAAAAAQTGIDIQLHTHRHVTPVDPILLRCEIEQNREVLEPLVGYHLQHFCYPSGIHATEHEQPLKQLDVLTATTCEAGLNYRNAPPLTLSRFLDNNDVSWIEFEAEMSGFAELMRNMRNCIRRTSATKKRV